MTKEQNTAMKNEMVKCSDVRTITIPTTPNVQTVGRIKYYAKMEKRQES